MKKGYFKSVIIAWLAEQGLGERKPLQIRYNARTGEYRAFFAQYVDGANILLFRRHSELCCPGRFSVDYITTQSGEEVVLKTEHYKVQPR